MKTDTMMKSSKSRHTEKMFIHQEDEINSAFEHLQVAGPPQAAWDNIAPGAEEAQELAHQEGISDECPMAEEDIQHHINQIVNDLATITQ